MADFLDEEAEETSENEEISEYEGAVPPKKLSKRRTKIQVEDSEDEEEIDEKIAEELRDFIQDEPVDEEDQEDQETSKRKHSDDEDDHDVDEEDLDLIEENIGIKIKRKKFRRVRPVAGGDSDEEDREKNDRDAIANQLFDDDNEDEPEPPQRKGFSDRAPSRVLDMEVGEDDEEFSDTDSFIVGDDGEPIHGPKRRTHRYNDAAMQEAQDIFGLDFDVGEFEDLEEEDEYGEEYEDEDEEAEPVRRIRRRKSRKSVLDVYEPSDLEHNLRTQFDTQVRLADIPERFQLRSIPVEAPLEEHAATEIQEEARWIYHQIFDEPTLSQQNKITGMLEQLFLPKPVPKEDVEGSSNETTKKTEEPLDLDGQIACVKEVLDFIRNQFLEDRFIAMYRKEYYQRAFNSEYIREIYERDSHWMQLQKRRKNLLTLIKRAQEFLKQRQPGNDHLDDNNGEISDEMLSKIREACSIIDLQDLFAEFKLRFGRHFQSMQKFNPKKLPVGQLGADATLSQLPEMDLEMSQTIQDEENAATTLGIKRARRTDPYVLCLEAGLDKFVAKFGLTAENFAKNCEAEFTIHLVETEPVDPDVIAENFVSARFPTAVEVQQAGVYMMSAMIARNANFRKVARKRFYQNAVLNVEATPRGLKEIDESHPCYGFKWMKAKLISSLEDDQYLKLMQAKKEGQMRVSIQTCAPGAPDPVLTAFIPMFAVDEFKRETVAWNSLRAKAVEKALMGLYATFEKEVHEKLLNEAKTYVKTCIRKRLFDWLSVAPVESFLETTEIDNENPEWNLSDGIRVMGIAFENAPDQPAYAAVVDAYGDVIETVKLPMLLYTRGHPGARLNPKDMEKIGELIAERRPHIIAIAAEAKISIFLKEAVDRVLNTLKVEKRIPETQKIPLEIVENRLSMLYQNSETGRLEFPGYTYIQRQAVSIARRLLDPLPVFAQLFNMDDDLLNLNFHPLQSQLSKEELRSILQVELVKRVNDVGVDVNQCVAHPLTHGNLVQFICGLGPRKAQNLLKTVKANGVIVSRNQLIMVCRMGPRVFVNCAGFIKIDVNALNDVAGDTYIEALDSSRVHPETYEWARKMAVDALEYDDTADGSNPSDALQEILGNPAKLQELDLNAFGDELERQNFGNKRITLDDIKEELNSRFKDYRLKYQSPSPEEIFEMVIGESVRDYAVGRLVTVKVLDFVYSKARANQPERAEPIRVADGEWMCPKCRRRGFFGLDTDIVYKHMGDHNDPQNPGDCPGAMIGFRVVVDNGITGMVALKDLSDKTVSVPQERVKRDMVIQARVIKAIDPQKFTADFTCKTSDLQDKENKFKPPKDSYYDQAAEQLAMDREMRKRNKNMPKTSFLKRVIAHPAFKNVNYEEAEKILRSMPPGEAIIRPHSKGVNKLTISWKVAEGILDHVEIVEQEKENAFSLGQKLLIGDEVYDDLDEILARYTMPMGMRVNELMRHKYYVDSHEGANVPYQHQRAVIDKWLLESKEKDPRRIPFCFSACVRYPRKFFLCHLPSKTVREEYVTITPSGLEYRKRQFSSVNQLINYFKQHFHEPPPVSNTPHASVTPGTAMLITPGSGVTPRMGTGGANLAAITQAVQLLPGHVWERLREAGGSTARGGASATPTQFATPRTPSGTSSRQVQASAATPSSVTGSTTAGWSNAAQMWRQAMAGQPSVNTPGTPQSVNTPGSTNWAQAAQQWVSAGSSATATTGNQAAPKLPNPTTQTAAAWLDRDRVDEA